MKKVGQYLLCVLPLICAIGIQIIVSIIGMIGYSIFLELKMGMNGEADSDAITNIATELMKPTIYHAILVITAVVSIVIFGLWYKHIIEQQRILKIHEIFTMKRILLIVILGIALQIGISVVLNAIGILKPEWFDNYNKALNKLVDGNSILSILLVVFIAPISEEIICRGVILEKCKKIMPLMAANIMQAVLFGIYHMNLIQGIYAFVLGLFLGMVCIKTGSIYGAIFLHMIFNLSGIILERVLPGDTQSMTGLFIGILIVAFIGIIFPTISFLKDNPNEIPKSFIDREGI